MRAARSEERRGDPSVGSGVANKAWWLVLSLACLLSSLPVPTEGGSPLWTVTNEADLRTAAINANSGDRITFLVSAITINPPTISISASNITVAGPVQLFCTGANTYCFRILGPNFVIDQVEIDGTGMSCPSVPCGLVYFEPTATNTRVTGCVLKSNFACLDIHSDNVVVGPQSPSFSTTDVCYFMSSTTAINVAFGVTGTKLSGITFGFNQFGFYQPILAPLYWIQDRGSNTLIGVDPLTSFSMMAGIQGNLFSPVVFGSFVLYGGNSTISGNLFGYEPSGSCPTISPSTSGTILAPFPVPSGVSLTIGTNGDESGDEREFNWFGCSNSPEALRFDTSTTATLSGNYFGFNTARMTTGTVEMPSFCQPQIWITSTGNTLIGSLTANISSTVTTNCFLGPSNVYLQLNDGKHVIRGNMFGTNFDGSHIPAPSSFRHHIWANGATVDVTVMYNAFIGQAVGVLLSPALNAVINYNDFGLVNAGAVVSTKPSIAIQSAAGSGTMIGNNICTSVFGILSSTAGAIMDGNKIGMNALGNIACNHLIGIQCIGDNIKISNNHIANSVNLAIGFSAGSDNRIEHNYIGPVSPSLNSFDATYGIVVNGTDPVINYNVIACSCYCIAVLPSSPTSSTISYNTITLADTGATPFDFNNTGIYLLGGGMISQNSIVGKYAGIFVNTVLHSVIIEDTKLIGSNIGVKLTESRSVALARNIITSQYQGLDVTGSSSDRFINSWGTNWIYGNLAGNIVLNPATYSPPPPSIISAMPVAGGSIQVIVQEQHSIGRTDTYEMSLYASSACVSGTGEGQVYVGSYSKENNGVDLTSWTVDVTTGTDSSGVVQPLTGFCYMSAIVTQMNFDVAFASSPASSQFSSCYYYCNSISSTITPSNSAVPSASPSPTPAVTSKTASPSPKPCSVKCLNGDCVSDAQECEGRTKNIGNDITPMTIRYTGSNRNKDLTIPIKQSSQFVGSIVVPAKTFPNNWTLVLRPPDREDNNEKLRDDCGEKQSQVTPAFDLIVLDSKGREREVRDLKKPLLLSIFTEKLSGAAVEDGNRVCFAFAGTSDRSYRCLDNTTLTETKTLDVYFAQATTDHLTSFAVLFLSEGGCGDSDALWIVSVTLISVSIAFVLVIGLAYMRSNRLRALVMGYDPSRSLSQVVAKAEQATERSRTSR